MADQEAFDAVVSSEVPRVFYDVTISGNEAAFWDFADVNNKGTLRVDAMITNSIAGGVEMPADVEIRSWGLQIELDVHSNPEWADRLSDSGTWFSGACVYPGGCSREGWMSVELVEPVDGQSVEVRCELTAELDTVGKGVPGGNAELTLTVEEQ